MSKKYEIWSSGYVVTGNSSDPQLMGISEGNTFKEACDVFFKNDKYYDANTLRHWGCGLFDNEKDAQ